jgi:hypothetical protein
VQIALRLAELYLPMVTITELKRAAGKIGQRAMAVAKLVPEGAKLCRKGSSAFAGLQKQGMASQVSRARPVLAVLPETAEQAAELVGVSATSV